MLILNVAGSKGLFRYAIGASFSQSKAVDVTE